MSGAQGEKTLDGAEIDAQIAMAEAHLERLRKLRDGAGELVVPKANARALHLHAWQEEALEDWRRHKYHGVVQAVTGAGKTWVGIAAIEAAERVGLRAVVLVPTRVLVSQWVAVLNKALPGVMVSTKIGDPRPWQVTVTTVQAAMNRPALKRSEHGLLIADECHRYGAEKFSQALRPEYERRLGLTATLRREDRGDQVLEHYFGGICHDLGYKRALEEELIAPYRFAYASVPLNSRERSDYDDIQDKLTSARRILIGDYGVPEEPFGEFYSAVSRLAGADVPQANFYLANFSRRQAVLAGTRMKFHALGALSPAVRASNGTIVFTQTQNASQEAVEALRSTGCSAVAVHSALDEGEREERLELFRTQQTTAISAPRILDEGVDVPEADFGIIMAANRGRRQTIQRLGRVLRRRPGKVAKFVVMYAGGTVEDPFIHGEAPDFYKECIPYAAEFGSFDLGRRDDLPSLLAFLGAAEDRGSHMAQREIDRAVAGDPEPSTSTETDEEGEPEQSGEEREDVAEDGMSERTHARLTSAHLHRLYGLASAAHHHLATDKYSLKGGILAACLWGDAATHHVEKSGGLEVLDVMLLYRTNSTKKSLAMGTLFSYDFGVSELGRHPDEDPAVFTGRRVNIGARVLKVGDADPDDAVRAWLKTLPRPQTPTAKDRAVLVWPRKYVGRVIGPR